MDNPQQKKAPRKRQSAQTKSRKVVKPESKEVELEVVEPVPNKYSPKERAGTRKLGRSPNYVTSVGLGKLEVITANGTTPNSDV